MICHRRGFSSSDAVRAVTGSASAFTWISAAGFAVRFRYQCGCFGAPPIDATTRKSSPSRPKISADVRGCPLLRPVVVSSRIGAPFQR